MCSIGRHEGADLPPRAPRRHTDGSVTAAVRKIPRTVLAKLKSDKTAELREDIATLQADEIAMSFGLSGDVELLPPDLAQLPFTEPDEGGDKQSRKSERRHAYLMHGETAA